MVAWACSVRVGLLVVDAMLALAATSYQVNSEEYRDEVAGWGLVGTHAGRMRFCVTDHHLMQRLTGFAQAGGINAHGHQLAQDVEQNHRAALWIGVLVDRFKPGKRTISDGDGVAR